MDSVRNSCTYTVQLFATISPIIYNTGVTHNIRGAYISWEYKDIYIGSILIDNIHG